jgi:PAS domain S-box-containing protein
MLLQHAAIGLMSVSFNFVRIECQLKNMQTTTHLDSATSLKNLQTVISSTGVGIWDWQVQTGEVVLSERWAQIIGYTLAELAPVDIHTWSSSCHPDDLLKSEALLAAHWSGQSDSYAIEVRMKHKLGHWVWVLDTGQVTEWFDNGKPRRMIGTHLDVTERRHQLALLELIANCQRNLIAETDFAVAFESLLDGILTITESEYGFIGEVLQQDNNEPYLKTHAITDISWNDETARFYRENSTDGLEFTNMQSLFGAAIVTQEPVIANLPATDTRRAGLPEGHPDLNAFLGLPILVNAELIAMVGLANRPGGYNEKLIEWLNPLIVTVGQVIAGLRTRKARFRDLEELRRSNQVMLKYFESSYSLLSITTLDGGVFSNVNPLWTQTLGYSAQEAIGKSAAELGIWGSGWNHAEAQKSLREVGYLRNFETVIYGRDQRRVDVLINAEILDMEAEQKLVLMNATDVTENIKVENQLRQSQKMEAIGQLTGGVAHDFNNLLNVIQSGTELLSDFVDNQPVATSALSSMQRAIERGAGLTQQLLAFSRRQHLAPKVVNVEQTIHTVMPLLSTTIGSNIQIVVHAEKDSWHCEVDPNQLESAILNLAINARDAMPSGGELRFTLGNIDIGRHERLPILGEHLRLSVTDNGEGMDPEHLDQAFEPFFTTKDIGKGTGLGLSMVFGFVRQSKGHIELSSERGVGTSVTMFLPRANPLAMPTALKTQQQPLQQGQGERVLLLEDDNDLRKLTALILSNFGYVVSEAANEAEVDELLDTGVAFDIMLSDIMLPGVNTGPDIAERVLTSLPGIKVLLMSGHAEHSVKMSALLKQHGGFLPKPFGQKKLTEAIRRLLDNSAQRPFQ